MADLLSSNGSISFTYGGIDQDGDVVIYMDSNAQTDPYPILCEANSGADFLQNLYWDEDRGLWVAENGPIRGQLT